MTGPLLRRHGGRRNLLKGKFYLEEYGAWCNKQNRCSAIVRGGRIKAEPKSARYCRQQSQFKPNKSALYQIGYRTSRQPWRTVQATKLIYSEIKKIRMRTIKSRAVLQWLYWNKTQKTKLKPHKRELKPQQLIKLKTTIESYYSAMLKYSKSTKGAIITNSQSHR